MVTLCGGVVVPVEAQHEAQAQPGPAVEEDAEEAEVEADVEETDEYGAGPSRAHAVTVTVANVEDIEPAEEAIVAPVTINNLANSLVAEQGGKIIVEMRESDGFVNATKMCKAGGKRWFNYVKSDETKKFLEELQKSVAPHGAADFLVKSSCVRGANGGTWVHPSSAAIFPSEKVRRRGGGRSWKIF